MRRTIVQPASLAGEPLGELKSWLGITRPADDTMLVALLEASHALCEAFTGRVPLAQLVEEELPFLGGAHDLAVEPVRALVSVEEIADDATRLPLAGEDYDFAIAAGGRARISFSSRGDGRTLAVRVEAGIAADWASLPPPLRQGIIRLAAHHFRERDRPAEARSAQAGVAAPASVTALWLPWRVRKLA
ncbi:hypothetical protein [Erythrobacter sp. HL-111]|uniref:head-tail connector protein n=1 Tax=Erythrobacter sp. HL-111 TaxID=1798193 RepID=UPI0006DBD1A7|nr:hypothetical protein [Erythrobacter sp. HL-111]KPP94107.1 MAG: gene transfer agent DNA packaging protein [Erythrobacteraceae bacterium HL-111]SDS62818.1 phage conserved hypothetical protein, phiE125 gp8 family [Erythrobacter sp. HL-111]